MRKLLYLAVLVAACSGGSKVPVIPTLPGDGDDNTAKPGAPGTEADPWADAALIPPVEPAAPAAIELPRVERFTLPNGLEVIVVPSDRLPLVSMQLAFTAGRRDVERGKTGLEVFAAQMLTQGTRKRSALEIASQIDFVGGQLSATATFEATLVSCSVLTDQLDTCLSVLPEVVTQPAFPADKMEEVRKQLLAQVRAMRDDPEQLATAHFQNLLWGDRHVRGWPMSIKSLEAITRDDLVAWHRRWLVPNNAVLAVSGDVDPAKLKAALGKAFRTWRKAKVPAHPAYETPPLEHVRVRLVNRPGSQTHIRIGHYGIAHKDDSFYATMVFNHVLGGGGFASRLMQVVRAREGKAYGATSSFDRNLERGAFLVQTFTRTAETMNTVGLLLQEIARMQAEGPTEAEVKDAIAHLAGSYTTRFQSASDFASSLLGARLHQLGPDYVRDFPLALGKVTTAAATGAAKQHLDPRRFVIVLVGDAARIAPQLQAAKWKWETVPYNEPVATFERDPALADLEPSKAQQQAGQKLLDQALAAKGGLARLRGIKSLSMEASGKISAGAQEVPVQLQRYFVVPDTARMDMILAGGQARISTAVTPEGGWAVVPSGAGPQQLPDSELEALRKNMWRDQELILLHARQPDTIVARLPDETHDGAPRAILAVIRADREVAAKLFLDKKTSRLLRMDYTIDGQKAVETYADFEKVDGVTVAHTRETISQESVMSIKVDKVEFNGTIDPGVFAQPK